MVGNCYCTLHAVINLYALLMSKTSFLYENKYLIVSVWRWWDDETMHKEGAGYARKLYTLSARCWCGGRSSADVRINAERCFQKICVQSTYIELSPIFHTYFIYFLNWTQSSRILYVKFYVKLSLKKYMMKNPSNQSD